MKLKIDGVQIEARPGQMIIEAAREAGIHIPYLCWHPILKPYGACRMCVVEASNARGFPTSCTSPVAEGIEIKTNTTAVEEIRRDILALTLSEHPHGCLTCWRIEHCGPSDICLRNVTVTDRCVVCPQNERCELQDVTYGLKLAEVPLPYKYRGVKLETRNPFIDHDMNLCIVCGKCVRACGELEGANAISFVERGGHTLVESSLGGTLAESGCTFCGLCVDVCPVGAITEKDSKWAGAAEEAITSPCSHCSVGCSLTLNVKKGKLIRSTFDIEGPANHGEECVRGKFGHKFVYSKDRILKPRVRASLLTASGPLPSSEAAGKGQGIGPWADSTWDEALALVAGKLAKYKPEEIFLLASPKNTNEDNYLLQKLGRAVLGTNNIDFIEASCPPAAAAGLTKAFGSSAATNSIWGLRDAKAIVVVDSDLTFEQPVAGLQVKEAVRRGAHLVVLDPRDTELGLLAAERLVCRPGTEAIVLGGIMQSLLAQNLHDDHFVTTHCQGLDDLKTSLASFTPEAVERLSGISQAKLAQVAKLLGARKPAAFLFGAGLYEPDEAVGAALANLAMLTGNIGKPGSGVFPLRGENNSQGVEDMGCQPNLLPGAGLQGSARSQSVLAELWGRAVPAAAGIGFDEMLAAVKAGKIKAIVAIGENQAIADRQGELAEALGNVEFVVLHEVLAGELGKYAQVLLPATTFAERDGTYTSIERRVQRVRQAIKPQGESRPAWQFLSGLAKQMEARGFDYAAASEIMTEIAQVVPNYAGISYPRLDLGGIQWPCPDATHPGTPVLHAGQFLRGPGLLQAMTWQVAPSLTADPFVLRTEAVPGARTRRTPSATPESPSATAAAGVSLIAFANVTREIKGTVDLLSAGNHVEINAADARGLGIADGDKVKLTAAMGVLLAKAKVNGRAPQGTVLVTMPQFAMVTDMFNKPNPGPLAVFAQAHSYPVRVEKST